MRMQKTLLSLAVAAGVGAASLPAAAAVDLSPKLYGDLALAFVSLGSAGTGTTSNYGLYDNVSLLGVKGEAAVIDGTKFFYDYNAILDITSGGAAPGTHLGIIGIEGPMGTVSAGRDNGLFVQMVDGSTYQTNWFYTPGMSSLQVGKSIKYVSPTSGGLQFGVQAFDISKVSNGSTNYTVAGTYGTGALTVGLGYTKYSKYGDGVTEYSDSSDTNQFGDPQNVFSGVLLKSKTGASVGYKAGKFGIVAAYDMRKPVDVAPNTSDIKTLMVTGSYAASGTTTLVANVSNTKQSDGIKGTIVTLMASYAPADNLFFSLEVQNSNADANQYGLTGTTYAGGDKSSTGVALGATYNF